mmetsp:Transcript_16258/g.19247  ORF Transcript_16258/g.19247 Transcript_16258/m.19247 type:complete len:580 (+) Transcript_16258:84-1823(+)
MMCSKGATSTIDYASTKTLIDTFEEWCSTCPNQVYLCQPMGGDKSNIKQHTYDKARTEVIKMATYIASLGLEPGSRIALMSKNCSWWILADLAIVMSGNVTVPIYPTLTGGTVEYILEHSDSQLCFVGKLDKNPWNEMKNGIPASMPVVTFPLCPDLDGEAREKYVAWDSILADTTRTDITPVQRAPEEMATIIYTSGSTGKAKGVMHDFGTMYVTTKGFCDAINVNSKDRYMSYLPLAHGMERWLGECVSLYGGVQVYFADSLATFVQDLNRARPTLFVSVPRLWTKFQSGVFQKMPPAKLNLLLKIPIINTIVKRKIIKGLGLDCVRVAGSGSAPIPGDLIQWYKDLGLELLEGYGMTENFNYSHMSRQGMGIAGSVGQTYDDVSHRIAEDGEIQVLTPGLMMGYYNNQEATDECITADGYLRTGDKGEIDKDGRLKITGRLKEIFKTAKGKYVAPAPIENKVVNHPTIELACVGGSGQNAAHVIAQLSEGPLKKADSNDERARIAVELEKHLKAVNATLDGHEVCQFIVVVKEPWLPENGFLTPTQKIVRNKIESAYAENYDSWYGAKKAVIWHGW